MKTITAIILTLLFLFLFSGNTFSQCKVGSGNITLTENSCYSGSIGVLDLNGKTLTISAGSTLEINNINGVGKIIVETGALFRLQSSLNMNGNLTVINNGIFYVRTIEMQNGVNNFENYGTVDCTELQISSNGSTFLNCGTITVSNATNFHAGRFELCNCGTLITNLLNVNATIVYGKGVITVNQVLNLNAILSTDASGKLSITYPKHLNNPERLGVVIKDGTCSNALPVTLQSFIVKKIGGGYKATMVFSKIENVKNIRIQVSSDSKTWKWVNIPINPKDIIIGKEYSVTFSL